MIKVIHCPSHYHFLTFGGFELQMLATINATRIYEIDCRKVNPWDRDVNFEIIHFWGLDIVHYDNIMMAKSCKKKIVITGLLNYYEDLQGKIKNYITKFIPSKSFLIRKMIPFIDALVVVNDIQKKIAVDFFGFDSKQVFVIPNIVNQVFFESIKRNLKYKLDNYQDNEFVLTTGNICKRKNQLLLVKACIKADVNLVIIGHPSSEEKYIKEFSDLVHSCDKIKWIKGVEANSDDLVSAYSNCSLFALPSFEETQPISLLEAATMQRPLLISNKAFAKQKYFRNAILINPNSEEEIAKGIKSVLNNPSPYIPLLPEECMAEKVGLSYSLLYKKIIHKD